jgi:hypothetical protein
MPLEKQIGKVKQFLRPLRALTSTLYLIKGVFIYSRTRVTPESAYSSLLNLYFITNGYSNAFFAWLLKFYRPPYKFPHANGILGDLDYLRINHAVQEIRENGYYVFDKILPEHMCEKLLCFALTQECSLRNALDSTPKSSIYDRKNPVAVTYWLKEEELITNPDIQMLMWDLSILSIAQAYLETQPVLDIVAMWWSTTFSKTACPESAQLYHFDMDRIKWLKFFIYLTDVTTDNGPHCYIAGSHRPGAKPKKLLDRGYTRIPDSDIAEFYSNEKFFEVTAPKGTIVAGDTLCFHKGKSLKTGDRLILELEFTNSLFGGSYSKSILSKLHSSINSHMFFSYPRLYLKFFCKKVD